MDSIRLFKFAQGKNDRFWDMKLFDALTKVRLKMLYLIPDIVIRVVISLQDISSILLQI